MDQISAVFQKTLDVNANVRQEGKINKLKKLIYYYLYYRRKINSRNNFR
jgi:hypothetical protein